MNKLSILFIKKTDSSFVLRDQRILGKYFPVKPYLLTGTSRIILIFRILGMIWFILRNHKDACCIVTWFADIHSAILSALGRLLGLKVIIFAGGMEAVSYPELGKGVYHHKFRGRFVKYALRNCFLIIPNHHSLLYHENHYYSTGGKRDGIKYYIPDLTTRIEIIPNGIDDTKFFRDHSIPKKAGSVLTVGTMTTWSDFLNKGFDLFILLAERNPNLAFTLIGMNPAYLSRVEKEFGVASISNLTIIQSFCPYEVLFGNYNSASIYIQASITEGMPNTLNEAMLCGCIPVGSDVNGIPDAIGNTGVIVKHREIGEFEMALYKALEMDTEREAIRHARANFTLSRRAAAIKALFESLEVS